MKKRWIAAVLALLLCLSACGSKSKEAPTQPETEETISDVKDTAFYSGTWTATGIQAKGVDFTAEQAAAMGINGIEKLMLVLASDKNACLVLEDIAESGLWIVTDDGIRIGNYPLPYADGRLMLEIDAKSSTSVYFEKQSDSQEMPESVKPAKAPAQPETTQPVTEASPTEAETETVTPAEEALTEPETTASAGIRPEFKDAMDSYEAFYNDYCEIMAKYAKNPTDLSILGKYADMLAKVEEMDKKFKAWDEGSLSNEELKYYLDVMNRVQKKMIDLF